MLYAIWDHDKGDWVRELQSKVDDGGIAILVFTSQRNAKTRAAKHFGYDRYADLARDGWVSVREVASPAKRPAGRKVVRKGGA